MQQPKVLIIQDISASCRISMNVAMPVLSCLNNSVHMLPTALLSTHTGADFQDYTFLDLTDEMEKILQHWKSLGIKFDGILIGYLGSHRQIEIVSRIIDEFTTSEATVVLDPVMGDNGELYAGFDEAYISKMRGLCRKATVIIPNVTEACYLAGVTYQAPYPKNEVKNLFSKLSTLQADKIVITGIAHNQDEIGAASMEKGQEEVAYSYATRFPGHFDGAGDLFSSVTAGFIFQKRPLKTAVSIAVSYTNRVIQRTLNNHQDAKYGVQFETDIPYLIENLYHENEQKKDAL